MAVPWVGALLAPARLSKMKSSCEPSSHLINHQAGSSTAGWGETTVSKTSLPVAKCSSWQGSLLTAQKNSIHWDFLLAGAVSVLSVLNWGMLDLGTQLSHPRTTHGSSTRSELTFKLLTQRGKQGVLFGGRAGL